MEVTSKEKQRTGKEKVKSRNKDRPLLQVIRHHLRHLGLLGEVEENIGREVTDLVIGKDKDKDREIETAGLSNGRENIDLQSETGNKITTTT